jgi:hypothetical protein
MDSLINQFYNTSVYDELSQSFIKDLNIIIRCIIEYYHHHRTFKIDIYDLLVSVGSDLIWNIHYFITMNEYNWFNTQGNVYIFNELSKNMELVMKNISFDEYHNLMVIYEKLIELYSLVLKRT